MLHSAGVLLFWLLVAHVICDYPLQGDFLSRGKNHRAPLPGIPWWQCLFAHALIQGGGVALVTGSLWLGVAETIAHATIDFGKCLGQYDFNADQATHLCCKGAWAIIAIYGLPGVL